MKKIKFSKLLLFFALLVFVLPIFAQEGGMTPNPAERAQIEATSAAYEQAFLAELAKRDIFDFQVVYLIASTTPIAVMEMPPDLFVEKTGAHIVHTWEDFLKINEELPVQVIFLHVSMLDQVDVEWMHHAYRNKVMIYGIGTPGDALKEVIGDYCFKTPNQHVKDFDEMQRTWFIQFIYAVKFSDAHTPEEIAHYKPMVDQDRLVHCSKNYTNEKISVEVMYGAGSSPLNFEGMFDAMVRTIITTSLDYEILGNKVDGDSE